MKIWVSYENFLTPELNFKQYSQPDIAYSMKNFSSISFNSMLNKGVAKISDKEFLYEINNVQFSFHGYCSALKDNRKRTILKISGFTKIYLGQP